MYFFCSSSQKFIAAFTTYLDPLLSSSASSLHASSHTSKDRVRFHIIDSMLMLLLMIDLKGVRLNVTQYIHDIIEILGSHSNSRIESDTLEARWFETFPLAVDAKWCRNADRIWGGGKWAEILAKTHRIHFSGEILHSLEV